MALSSTLAAAHERLQAELSARTTTHHASQRYGAPVPDHRYGCKPPKPTAKQTAGRALTIGRPRAKDA